jgi:hypothetical protein
MSERVYTFSNGSQYADWQNRNCDGCAKFDPDNVSPEACDLDYALGSACLGDGLVDIAIARRIGYTDGPGAEGHYTWPCPERVAR